MSDDELEAWSGGDEAQEVGSVKKKKNRRYVINLLSPSILSPTYETRRARVTASEGRRRRR